MTLQLHEFQKQAVAAVRAKARQGHRRLVLTVPCGGGKTVMAAAMMQAASHRGKNSLFLAPARELIRQCSEKLTSYGIHHGIVMAGHGFTRSRVQVASVQTIQARAFRTNKISLPQADLVVVDEAHLFGGEKFMEVLRCYPEAVVIGLTATPLGANNKPMPDDFYSDVVVGATTSDLIGQGFIVPVRCWAPYTPLLKRKKGERAFTATGDYRDDFLEKRMNKPKLIGDIVKHWVKLGEGRPTVATAVSVAHSQAIVGEFIKKGIRFGHVDGTTEPELRQELFGRFKDGKLQGLSSCGVLHTGVDFPWASCGILARPTKSLRLYLQIVGRIMRSYPGKKDCIARGSKILTDRGLVEIQDVTLDHKVWDGVEFVRHAGAVCRGVQPTITYGGVTATPDHEIMTNEGWRSIQEAAARRLPVAVTGVGGTPIRFSDDCVPQDRRRVLETPGRGGVLQVRPEAHDAVPQLEEEGQHQGLPTLQPKTPSASPLVAVPQVPRNAGKVRKPERPGVPQLRRAGDQVPFRQREPRGALDSGEPGNSRGPVLEHGSDRQQQALRTRESALGHRCRTAKQHAEEQGRSAEIYSIPEAPPGDSVCGLDVVQTDQPGPDGRPDPGEMVHAFPQAEREVWDILNAGPLQRFTANGRLVHNCHLLDHAGCVAYHGFPDEDQDWKLGGDSDQAEENAKKREEGDQKKPIHCPQCHTMFSNSNVCPACGFEVKKRQDPNKVKPEAGILVEICRDPSSPLGRQNLAKLWHKCLAIASARNETFGLAASMFIREAKTPPWKLNFLPNLPQPDGWKMFVRDVYPQYTRHRVL